MMVEKVQFKKKSPKDKFPFLLVPNFKEKRNICSMYMYYIQLGDDESPEF